MFSTPVAAPLASPTSKSQEKRKIIASKKANSEYNITIDQAVANKDNAARERSQSPSKAELTELARLADLAELDTAIAENRVINTKKVSEAIAFLCKESNAFADALGITDANDLENSEKLGEKLGDLFSKAIASKNAPFFQTVVNGGVMFFNTDGTTKKSAVTQPGDFDDFGMLSLLLVVICKARNNKSPTLEINVFCAPDPTRFTEFEFPDIGNKMLLDANVTVKFPTGLDKLLENETYGDVVVLHFAPGNPEYYKTVVELGKVVYGQGSIPGESVNIAKAPIVSKNDGELYIQHTDPDGNTRDIRYKGQSTTSSAAKFPIDIFQQYPLKGFLPEYFEKATQMVGLARLATIPPEHLLKILYATGARNNTVALLQYLQGRDIQCRKTHDVLEQINKFTVNELPKSLLSIFKEDNEDNEEYKKCIDRLLDYIGDIDTQPELVTRVAKLQEILAIVRNKLMARFPCLEKMFHVLSDPKCVPHVNFINEELIGKEAFATFLIYGLVTKVFVDAYGADNSALYMKNGRLFPSSEEEEKNKITFISLTETEPDAPFQYAGNGTTSCMYDMVAALAVLWGELLPPSVMAELFPPGESSGWDATPTLKALLTVMTNGVNTIKLIK